MAWFVIDGMDGSGKTTSSDYIRKELESRGRKVLEITHPNHDRFFGRVAAKFLTIDNKMSVVFATVFYILDVVCSLFKMKIKSRDYDDVIFVRYILAVAYLPESLCPFGYKLFSRIFPMPDVKVFVDVDSKTAMERILERGEELEIYETEEKLDKTRRKMQSITEGWIVVDNSSTREYTEKQTAQILSSLEGMI